MLPDMDGSRLMMLHSVLFCHLGAPSWWPGETPMEVAIGAILTQNTSWSNVEKGIENLRKEGLLTSRSLSETSRERIASCIRPAGYYNQKSSYLKEFAGFVEENLQGEIGNLSRMDPFVARNTLLDVKGIGKETADSILCYAAGLPVLVIDAYTYRVLGRYLGIDFDPPWRIDAYDDLAGSLMNAIMGDTLLYNRFHALLVLLGKNICKKTPICGKCPLRENCSYSKSVTEFGSDIRVLS